MTHKAKILIIEDDTDLNDAYRMILETSGYDVEVAFNGKEALDSLKAMKTEPKVIFLDLRMPVMDGLEFLKHYHTSEHPGSTVVIFSNYDAQKEVNEAYELGASRYILKARATPNELVRIVRDIAG